LPSVSGICGDCGKSTQNRQTLEIIEKCGWKSTSRRQGNEALCGRYRHRLRADARAADLADTIAELQAAGATSLRAIAAGLNERGIPTALGEGEWTATQVMRVLERLDPFEAAA
jgi:hypothetical protein